MSYSIVYSSKTGNTGLLAETIRAALPGEACVYFGPPDERALAAETVYAGFWTDKGSCDETMAAFLAQLTGQKVFLFGTAGFGGAEAYFQKILEAVRTHLKEDVPVIGTFMCQGRMPQGVRARYEAMQDSPRRQAMLDNFDRALTHPDQDDLDRLREAVLAAR